MKILDVAAAVIEKDGKIFAAQRGYGDYKDYWEFPGGKIEEGESPEEALKREILEELDTKIEVREKIALIEEDYPEFHLRLHCYKCTILEGDLILKEAEDARWLKREDYDSVSWLKADQRLIDILKGTIKAVLFDFNGTLFFDGLYNAMGWEYILNKITDGRVDFEDFHPRYASVNNAVEIRACLEEYGIPYDEDFVQKASHEKEVFYQTYIRENHLAKLAKGAERFLDYLKERKIPINMATASIEFNRDFYFSDFPLAKWFDIDLVVYDDGSFEDKTDMYREAARRIGVLPEECLVIEDREKGMREALKAGVRKLIYMNSNHIDSFLPEIVQEAKDFDEIDRNILGGE